MNSRCQLNHINFLGNLIINDLQCITNFLIKSKRVHYLYKIIAIIII